MIDVMMGVSLGLGAVNSVANVVEGVMIGKTRKQVAEIKGSTDTAASAYATAKDAEALAAKANQHADWLHAELDKQRLLPEQPKTNTELFKEYMKSMVEAMTSLKDVAPPQNNNQTVDTKALTEAVTAAVVAAMNNQSK